jgi:hypothetical protein
MVIKLVKILMVLSTGIIIGYLIFSQKTVSEKDNVVAKHQDIQKPVSYPLKKITKPEIKIGESIDKETLAELDNLIESQQQQIANLELSLEQQIALNKQLIAKTEAEEVDGLEVLTMTDFEERMKDQFFDRFKGYAIELSGKRLETMQKEFDRDTGKSEWSSQYESNINSYILDNDLERLHFVDELNCNSHMCRLKVSSSEPTKWNRLFLSLTQQKWYNSITLKESSEDPNVFIYFITKPKSEI